MTDQAGQRRCRECGHRLGGAEAEKGNWTVCGGGEHCWCMADRGPADAQPREAQP